MYYLYLISDIKTNGFLIEILDILSLICILLVFYTILSKTNNYLPLAMLSVIPFVYILGQSISFNFIQFGFINYFYNSFSEKLYNIKQVQNQYFHNILDYKQQIIYASANN